MDYWNQVGVEEPNNDFVDQSNGNQGPIEKLGESIPEIPVTDFYFPEDMTDFLS